MIRNLFSRIIFLALVCSFYSVFGQTISNPDSALQNILLSHKGTRLSLKQAVDYALSNATSVRKAEAAYLAALGAVRRESGFFDPALFFNFSYQSQNTPTASFFAGADILETRQTNYLTGLRMNLPIGTELELSVNAARLRTNSAFAFLNPEFDTFGSLNFRQPLLNGFNVSARENLNVARRQLEAQKSRYDQQTTAVSSQVEQTYWDLYAIERNYSVQQLIRNQAEALLNETELRAKSGLVGPNQVANARTFLAEQDLLLLDREEQLDSQSDMLASLIGVRPDPGMLRFIPYDNPPTDFNLDNTEVLIESALKNNLELQASQHDIDAISTQRNAAKWQSLPTLNLVGSIGGSGLAGTPRDVVFQGEVLRASRSGSFQDALNQVTKRDFPNWNIGFELNIPIGLRSGLGEKDRLEALVYNAQQQYTELSRSIEEQVRTAWREVNNGKRRIKAAAEGVSAAQEQVRIGLIEFHNGRSTAFELVRLGADLATAQQRYSEALVRTAKAAAVLRSLTSGNYTGAK